MSFFIVGARRRAQATVTAHLPPDAINKKQLPIGQQYQASTPSLGTIRTLMFVCLIGIFLQKKAAHLCQARHGESLPWLN